MSIFEERYQLDTTVAEAESELNQARRQWEAAAVGAMDHPAVRALREHEDAVIFHKLGADTSPEHGRQLVVALCQAVVDNPDLKLTAIGASRFRVDDLAPERRYAEARAVHARAVRARDQFMHEHRGEFEAAAKQAEVDVVRTALESGDTEQIREALGMKSKALTTAHLGR